MGDNRAMVVKVCRGSGAHLDRLVESELLFLGDPIEEDLCRAAGASVSQGTATGSDPNQVCGKGGSGLAFAVRGRPASHPERRRPAGVDVRQHVFRDPVRPAAAVHPGRHGLGGELVCL